MASPDLEKSLPTPTSPSPTTTPSPPSTTSSSPPRKTWLIRLRHLLSKEYETRGIIRVPPSLRHPLTLTHGYLQTTLLWFTSNMGANNLTLAMLGPAVYSLSFTDTLITSLLGALIGSLAPAYVAKFGYKSGCRVMVFARYTLGWWVGKLAALMTLVDLLGYSVINGVVAGQILSAVAEGEGGALSVSVGIGIVAVVVWVVSTFGYEMFHRWERYGWVPVLVAYFVLGGVAGNKFDLGGGGEVVVVEDVSGARVSFFGLCFANAVTYAANGGDYFVYFPEETSDLWFFVAVMGGLIPSFVLTFTLGAGLASALNSVPSWGAAYSQSQGALVVTALQEPLGKFGSFLSVVLALSLVSNIIPGAYSTGVDFQVLGRYFARVPRAIWTTVGVIIWLVCGIAGQANLAAIFTNFLALIGYWFSSWVVMVIMEDFIFRRNGKGWWWKKGEKGPWRDGWDWQAWDQRQMLPIGIAGLVALIVAYAGAVLCMTQVWFIGPIAKAAFGPEGGDLGNYVGMGLTVIVYFPLRWWELSRFQR